MATASSERRAPRHGGPLATGGAPSGRGLRRLARDEDGQMLLLVMSLLLMLSALGGYVLDVADRVHARTVAQEAVDVAAYTAAAETARGLNYISNANLAILEMTATMAAIDAIQPTVDFTRDVLLIEQGVARAAILVVFPPGISQAGSVANGIIEGQLQYLRVLESAGRVLRSTLYPALEAGRAILSGLTTFVAVSIQLDVVPLGEGVKAAHAALPGSHAYELPPTVVPLQRRPLQHYGDRARPYLDRLGTIGTIAFLPTVNIADAVATILGFFGVDIGIPNYRHNLEEQWGRHVRRVQVWTLAVEGGSVTQSHVDERYRRTWNLLADPPRPWLPALFSGGSERRIGAIAESLTFNADAWDLVTPRWEAALVPVRARFGGPLPRGLPLTTDPAEFVLGVYDMHH